MNLPELTPIEQLAEQATSYPSLAINLSRVRLEIATVLSEWKGAGFFREYSDHSFDHVIDMLTTAEWLIPHTTKSIMTPADWLMLTLSIYLHDVGLLVTEQEYNARLTNPDFKIYLSTPVLTAEKLREYAAGIEKMPGDQADRLQYQEFVRLNHGKRVRSWIESHPIIDTDPTSSQKAIVAELLSGLDDTARKDLAKVCESHTLSNIDDTNIYRISKPYGGDRETVNLQYVAAILRTVDLLQITRRRTPSVLFQLINPGNPLSQLEWKKQSAVRAIRPMAGRDREGKVDAHVVPDTIEVHATFKEPDGFFALTSYLAYAAKEISQTYAAVQRSKKDSVLSYDFPWRYINTDSIDTEGFLTDSFEFELDQHKILELLTGHTLYNNSQVVLRELTQNALDAVRLQSTIESTSSDENGSIRIEWDGVKRTLSVIDNGTGMSQDMIVNHLLKVGSSRYQDPKFKEKYPSFHSISRFGIGVLSAFMISDDVEITTCHADDEEARQITLRSVHGKYLIKTLNKETERDQILVYPHGTRVKLTIRSTADVGDVLKIARQWLIFPRCDVQVRIDGAELVKIGYETPKEAIEQYLESSLRKSRFKKDYEVFETERDGVSVAYALAKDDIFEDRGFVHVGRRDQSEADDVLNPTCVCVEGVAVEQSTPGFTSLHFVAVANAVGLNAPKTNVARSALEDTVERRRMLDTVYEIYSEHVTREIARVASSEGVSLTRAVSLAPFVARPLTYPSVPASRSEQLSAALEKVPLLLIESPERRENVSIGNLLSKESFVTVESPLYRSTEQLIKESPADVTSAKLLELLGNSVSVERGETVLCNINSSGYVNDAIKSKYEIREVYASIGRRELKLVWKRRGADWSWLSPARLDFNLIDIDRKFFAQYNDMRDRYRQHRFGSARINIPLAEAVTYGLDNEAAFVSHGEVYLVPGTEVAKFLATIYAEDNAEKWYKLASYVSLLEHIRNVGWTWDTAGHDELTRLVSTDALAPFAPYLAEFADFTAALRDTPPGFFDAGAWDKRSQIVLGEL